jgi:23S rRNA (guanosine2251-2'-O)-methyltransferase
MRKLRNSELGRLSSEEYTASEKTPLILVLDNIRSMHNVGSIFRTADCFRVAHIYLCGLTPIPGHAEIEKTALGATESVDWSHNESTMTCLKELRKEGHRIAALEQAERSTDLRDYHANGPTVLVLGHEVKGVAQEVVDFSDDVIEIKQFGTKHSLNVSVSTGMAVYELHKQLSSE